MKIKNETIQEKAKRILLMGGDYYSPQDFGFNSIEQMQINMECAVFDDGTCYYDGYEIKDIKF